jgi:twitching motility protein PilT
MNTQDILLKAVQMKASDLHITVGVPCTVRVHGKLKYLDEHSLTPNDAKQITQVLFD